MELSYCVVNTNGRDYLRACLDAIVRTHPHGVEHEVLVLDNCSDDGSADAVRQSGHDVRLIENDRRRGKAENDSRLLREACGRFCLLLNEDSELHTGAQQALLEELRRSPGAAVAGAQLVSTEGAPKACAWRLPGIRVALASAFLLHRAVAVQSRGRRTRKVGWTQSSAMLVRREAAAQVGYLDPAFFVYSDETDFCKRLRDAGWDVLFVPGARATHHDQLSTDSESARRRIVEFHRGRDRYLKKHHPGLKRAAMRALGAWFYGLLALLAAVSRRGNARRLLVHARQELLPWWGQGIREAAEEYNRRARNAP